MKPTAFVLGGVLLTACGPESPNSISSDPLDPADIPQSTIGELPGIAGATDDGIVQYDVPLPLLPGLAGVQPSISLSYNDATGSFGLGGLDALMRCPQRPELDAEDGATTVLPRSITWNDAEDRWCFQGERLVAEAANQNWSQPGYYRLRNDRYIRFFLEPARGCGIAYHSNGGQQVFGDCSHQFEELSATAGDAAVHRVTPGSTDGSRVFAMHQVLSLDANGNYFEIEYEQLAGETIKRPSAFLYTGNHGANRSPVVRTRLVYEPAATAHTWISDAAIIEQHQLSQVQLIDGRNNSVVGFYRLGYEADERRRLEELTYCAAADDCLRPTRFTWDDPDQAPLRTDGGEGAMIGGEGVPPLSHTCAGGSIACNACEFEHCGHHTTPGGYFHCLHSDDALPPVECDPENEACDFRRDGVCLCVGRQHLVGECYETIAPTAEYRSVRQVALLDVSGDNLPDLVEVVARYQSDTLALMSRRNLGDGQFSDAMSSAYSDGTALELGTNDHRSNNLLFGDVDCDGRMDVVRAFEPEDRDWEASARPTNEDQERVTYLTVYLGTEQYGRYERVGGTDYSLPLSYETTSWFVQAPNRVQLADVTGDGCSEILILDAGLRRPNTTDVDGGWNAALQIRDGDYTWLSFGQPAGLDGSGSIGREGGDFYRSTQDQYVLYLGDVNGDSAQDLVQIVGGRRERHDGVSFPGVEDDATVYVFLADRRGNFHSRRPWLHAPLDRIALNPMACEHPRQRLNAIGIGIAILQAAISATLGPHVATAIQVLQYGLREQLPLGTVTQVGDDYCINYDLVGALIPGDFNGDRRLDFLSRRLVEAQDGDGHELEVAVLESTGGRFVRRVVGYEPANEFMLRPQLTDLDGDGVGELVGPVFRWDDPNRHRDGLMPSDYSPPEGATAGSTTSLGLYRIGVERDHLRRERLEVRSSETADPEPASGPDLLPGGNPDLGEPYRSVPRDNGPNFGNLRVRTVDLDGDGASEIISYASPGSRLRTLRGSPGSPYRLRRIDHGLGSWVEFERRAMREIVDPELSTAAPSVQSRTLPGRVLFALRRSAPDGGVTEERFSYLGAAQWRNEGHQGPNGPDGPVGWAGFERTCRQIFDDEGETSEHALSPRRCAHYTFETAGELRRALSRTTVERDQACGGQRYRPLSEERIESWRIEPTLNGRSSAQGPVSIHPDATETTHYDPDRCGEVLSRTVQVVEQYDPIRGTVSMHRRHIEDADGQVLRGQRTLVSYDAPMGDEIGLVHRVRETRTGLFERVNGPMHTVSYHVFHYEPTHPLRVQRVEERYLDPERSHHARTEVELGYDQFGRVASTTVSEPEGDLQSRRTSVQFSSDDARFIESTRASNGVETNYEHHPVWGVRTATIDPNGNRTAVYLDRFGRPVVREDAFANRQSIYFCECGGEDNPAECGGATACPSGAHSFVRTVDSYSAGDDDTERVVYRNEAGAVVAVEDQYVRPEGNRVSRTELAYDRAGRVVRRTEPHALSQEEDPVSIVTSYDDLGRLEEMSSPSGARLRYRRGFDSDHEDAPVFVEIIRDSPDETATPVALQRFDLLGRLRSVRDAIGGTVSRHYSLRDELLEIDTDAGTWSFEYNEEGELVRLWDPNRTGERDQGADPTELAYDAYGQLARRTEPGGYWFRYFYDQMARTVGRQVGHAKRGTVPLQATTWVYRNRRNNAGEAVNVLISAMDWDYTNGFRAAFYRNFHHHADGRVRRVDEFHPAQSIQTSTQFCHDESGRTRAQIFPDGVAQLNEYNGVVRAVHSVEADSCDALEEGEARELWRLGAQSPSGQIIGEEFGNGYYQRLDLDRNSGRPFALSVHRSTDLNSDRLLRMEYGYDAFGRMEDRISENSEQSLRERFTFNARDELTEVRHNGEVTLEQSTNRAGNPIIRNGQVFRYDPVRTNALVAVGHPAITYSYDSRGLIRQQHRFGTETRFVEHDAFSQPTHLYDREGRTHLEYGPDGALRHSVELRFASPQADSGRGTQSDRTLEACVEQDNIASCLREVDPESSILWDGGVGIRRLERWISGSYERELDGDALRHHYRFELPDGRPVALLTRDEDGDAYTYLHSDPQGTVVMTSTDAEAAGTVLSYDAYGQRRDSDTWELIPFENSDARDNASRRGYTGNRVLPGGLVLSQRLYDPSIGRFLEPDPLIPDPNQAIDYGGYAYARNNPIDFSDASGFAPCPPACGDPVHTSHVRHGNTVVTSRLWVNPVEGYSQEEAMAAFRGEAPTLNIINGEFRFAGGSVGGDQTRPYTTHQETITRDIGIGRIDRAVANVGDRVNPQSRVPAESLPPSSDAPSGEGARVDARSNFLKGVGEGLLGLAASVAITAAVAGAVAAGGPPAWLTGTVAAGVMATVGAVMTLWTVIETAPALLRAVGLGSRPASAEDWHTLGQASVDIVSGLTPVGGATRVLRRVSRWLKGPRLGRTPNSHWSPERHRVFDSRAWDTGFHEALDELVTPGTPRSVYPKIAALRQRIENLRRDDMHGVITYDQLTIERNRIHRDILELGRPYFY